MTAPTIERSKTPDVRETEDPDKPWVTIVWNDPVNLMSYVTWVFQKLFGYSKDKATALMLDVHHKGRAAVSNGSREQMEHDVATAARGRALGNTPAGLKWDQYAARAVSYEWVSTTLRSCSSRVSCRR